MKDVSKNVVPLTAATNAPALLATVDRATFQAEVDKLRVREKAPCASTGDPPRSGPASRPVAPTISAPLGAERGIGVGSGGVRAARTAAD